MIGLRMLVSFDPFLFCSYTLYGMSYISSSYSYGVSYRVYDKIFNQRESLGFRFVKGAD
jgi:hypothetical protein